MPYPYLLVASCTDYAAWIGAVGSIISPLIALIIGWRLARRDALREARIQAFAELSNHMQSLRTHYQRLEDELAHNSELSENRKNDYLNRIADVVTLLNVDRLMFGLLFGGAAILSLLKPLNGLIRLSVQQGNLASIDMILATTASEMRELGTKYLGVK